MIVGFLSNRFTNRGTEVALYDYADCNESILHNKSIVITRELHKIPYSSENSPEVYSKFNARFPVIYYETPNDIDRIVKEQGIQVLFIEKAGAFDGLISKECKNFVHCVFTTKEPHGDLYTALHEFINMNDATDYPVLPYMVRVHPTEEDMRTELGIPKDALIFGTYSGESCFNIDYVRDVVQKVGHDPAFKNIYFIFLGITPYGAPSDRIRFLPKTSVLETKRKFINTCDAMLYGRGCGETFGLACGEFANSNKPIIASLTSVGSLAHLMIMGDDVIGHDTSDELYDILTNWDSHKKEVTHEGYKYYSPENVMKIFKGYLDDLVKN
jgi:hypothetical protein